MNLGMPAMDAVRGETMNHEAPAILDFRPMANYGLALTQEPKAPQFKSPKLKRYHFDRIPCGHSKVYETADGRDNRRVRSSLGSYAVTSGRRFITKAVPAGLRVRRVL